MKKVRMTLVGLDGNGMALVAAFRRNAREQGWPEHEIDAVTEEAMAADYGHLVTTLYNHTTDERPRRRVAC